MGEFCFTIDGNTRRSARSIVSLCLRSTLKTELSLCVPAWSCQCHTDTLSHLSHTAHNAHAHTHLAHDPRRRPGPGPRAHVAYCTHRGHLYAVVPSVRAACARARWPLTVTRDAHSMSYTLTPRTNTQHREVGERTLRSRQEQPRLALHIQSSTQLLASRAHGCVSHVSCAAAPSASSSSRESSSFLRCASLALSTAAMPAGCERRIALLPCGGKLRLGRAKRGPRGAFSIIALSVAAMQSGRRRDAGAPRAFRRGPTEPSRATGGAAAAGADRCMH